MPYKMTKLKSGKYRVVNRQTGKVRAKATTMKKAKALIRMSYAGDRKRRKRTTRKKY